MNRVLLIGRLGVDPELKQGANTTLCNFTLATTERWTDRSGEKKERTEWHRIVTFAGQATLCAKYLKKGSQVAIEGQIQYRTWEKDGQKKNSTEIVADKIEFVGMKQGSEQATPAQLEDDVPPF